MLSTFTFRWASMQEPYSIVSVSTPRSEQRIAAVTDYVAAPEFPCVGARSAFNKDRVRFGMYAELGSGLNVQSICEDLHRFSDEFRDPGCEPVTYIAMFENEKLGESQFARQMWQQLQAMHEYDREKFAWDSAVSANPTESDFSFSIAARAYFIVGLHPAASRFARRSPMPCLVFNFHDQFESLRASGKYAGMQKVIRSRDMDLQGTINPALAQFGTQSEARQYSGVAVESSWKCPFHPASLLEAA